MLLIDCPYCGPRDETEFSCGGEAHIARPLDTDALSDARMGRLPVHAQEPEGRAVRALGPCARLPALVQRRARHRHPQDHRKVYKMGEPQAVSDHDAIAPAQGGRIDRSTAPRASPSTAGATRAIPATRSPRRCSPTACISSGAASSITGRAASSTAGSEEPNALVQLGEGARTEPNCAPPRSSSTTGWSAASQNRWPSLGFDIGAINNLLSRYFPAGFYYKTFMWPPSFWMNYEHFIRRAAGLGKAPERPDPDRYDKTYAHCDVLVVGGGPAGLAAALAAAAPGRA